MFFVGKTTGASADGFFSAGDLNHVFCGGPNQDLQQQARLRHLGRQSRKVMGMDADDDDGKVWCYSATALILEDFRGLPSGYLTY